ncbi:MAG: SH3 domain-containing protein [Anaerolineae bacterium]|jgi:GH25 family lysozyme M1 (1,4-beta-N-acetylmuramidase)/exopolysaccharide biosynthesis protein|nr:SH3 domain-containing protein [Anaerolineae bacterium]MBT4458472.1 SH3 domain-containing protein [Anaerolineae bacterium]MBT4843531.1 SH3 domain-containing protein [Anaerolineae bacterium]MBT6062702.1 SH3 domain-containing protein [Anaerolineae bacterium]MBT6322421.1 SH3 domain-containing protein [Anaerolineae bacterium]
MANAIGPDVSFYQDEEDTPEGIDFHKMRERADFVIIRAGQNQWIDPDFRTNWKAAKEAGLPRGSYWFYDSRVEPQRQAELWRDALEGDLGELPLCADFEESYGGPYAGWRKWYGFLEYLKDLMPGKEIILYTGYYYWLENAPDANRQASSLEYFHQYPLWIARYNATEPLVPAPWKKDEWMLWQYTETGDGKGFGVESRGIDLNYFNGDAAAFRARFNISDEPPPSSSVNYKVDLNLRKDPDRDSDVVGVLENDELVERLQSSSDGKWLKVKRANGDEGWSAIEHLIRQVDDTPDPDSDPEKEWARVLPNALNVREGDSALFTVVGTLEQDQVVKILEYNDDKSWIKILVEPAGLTGWCDTRYFVFLDSPPDTDPDPDPDPDPDIDKWYRVVPHALNVRQGPSTTYEVAGTVVKDEVVEKIEMDDDEKWFKIRNGDGLVGWVYASYLVETEAPDPGSDPDPDPDPDPGNEFLGRFQVTANSLNVREGAGTSNAKVGSVKKNDIVLAVEANEDGSWRKIEIDDLVGWCSARYLARYPQPTAINQKYFNKSVRYIREINSSPRKMIVHVFVVDMHYADLKFLVTPPKHNSDTLLCGYTTSEFVERHGVQIAINGDGYQIANDPDLLCPDGRDLFDPNSYAASRGKVYSQRMNASRPIMYINQKNEVTYNQPKGSVYNAISGDRMLVDKGKPISGLDNTTLEPRTAIGTNGNGRWMVMIVVDGRQPGYSEGCTLEELADMLIKFGGVYNAINLDGGGSSAMVIEKDGKADLLNSPIEGGIAGRERRVANHLGIEIG